MPLDGLLEFVKELQGRIDTHQDMFRQSEALTRYALIDPLLRELGWDTGDPTQVVPEYRSQAGSADYALFGQGDRPAIIVEAKKLGTPLEDAVKQVINYCMQEGIDYFAVTDGGSWELYETHKRGTLSEKIVTRIEVRSGSAAEVCRKGLALWRPSVEEGCVGEIHSQIVGPAHNQSNLPEPPISNPKPIVSGLDEHAWQPISGLDTDPGLTPPVGVRFPDNSTVSVVRWNSMLVEIIRWLINARCLDTGHCPIKAPNSEIYRVAASPVHPSGKKFNSVEQIGSIYVEKHGNIRQIVLATRFIICQVSQDPTQFKVRFS